MPELILPPALQQVVERVGGGRRMAIAGVGVATVVLVLLMSRWATAPTWVPLYSGLPLETVGQVTARLDEGGIQYQLDQGGDKILVQTGDLARARVALAAEGLPETGRPGLELFDQPSWGMTDFTQRINYRRALVGELERTIGKMRGVENAKVHLARSESNSFRTPDAPIEASVVIKQRNGQDPSDDVVRGIQHLVASSISGLESGRVAVLDDTGRLLSVPDEPGSIEALTSRQLSLQREVESYLERKAEDLVSQVVGAGNVRVQVAANINFDRVERTTQSVDPDLQVLASEQKSEIIPGAEGGAGSSTSATSYENSRSTESFSGAIGNVRRLSVAVLVNRPAGAEGAPQPIRSAEELGQIESLVRGAVGVDETRGDLVSVSSLAFTVPADPFQEPEPDAWTMIERFHREGITVLALLIAAFVALRAFRSLRQPVQTFPVLAGAGVGPVGALPVGDGHEDLEGGDDGEGDRELELGASVPALVSGEQSEAEMQLAALLPKGALSTNMRMRKAVVESVRDNPEISMRVVRSWLREG